MSVLSVKKLMTVPNIYFWVGYFLFSETTTYTKISTLLYFNQPLNPNRSLLATLVLSFNPVLNPIDVIPPTDRLTSIYPVI